MAVGPAVLSDTWEDGAHQWGVQLLSVLRTHRTGSFYPGQCPTPPVLSLHSVLLHSAPISVLEELPVLIS